MRTRRRLIVTGVVVLAALGGGIAAAVVELPGGGGKAKRTPHLAVPLPAAARNGGYFRDSAAGGSAAAQAATAGPGQRASTHAGELRNEFLEAYALRAYPHHSVTIARAQAAQASFRRLPLTLNRAIAPNATSSLKLTAAWQSFGPDRALSLPYEFTNLPNRPTVVSGRVTALAIGRTCVTGNCRLYVGTAGGGGFRTDNALAAIPVWR